LLGAGYQNVSFLEGMPFCPSKLETYTSEMNNKFELLDISM